MRERGRILSEVEFEQHLANSNGTVLLEYPTLGWRVLRVWWTPDDVSALADAAGISRQSPDSEGAGPSPFETWCYDTYTDLQGGHAFLVPLYLFGSAFQRFGPSLRARHPAMKTALVRSALVHFARGGKPNGNP